MEGSCQELSVIVLDFSILEDLHFCFISSVQSRTLQEFIMEYMNLYALLDLCGDVVIIFLKDGFMLLF